MRSLPRSSFRKAVKDRRELICVGLTGRAAAIDSRCGAILDFGAFDGSERLDTCVAQLIARVGAKRRLFTSELVRRGRRWRRHDHRDGGPRDPTDARNARHCRNDFNFFRERDREFDRLRTTRHDASEHIVEHLELCASSRPTHCPNSYRFQIGLAWPRWRNSAAVNPPKPCRSRA